MSKLLTLTDGRVSHSGREIVRGVSLYVEPGTVVALLGPNGAGKTTLLEALIGLSSFTQTDKTSILLAGNELKSLPAHERIASGLAFLPQVSSLFTTLSVRENLAMIYDYHPYWSGRPRDQFLEEQGELLEIIGLDKRLTQASGTLSGGQKRKLEVIRALLMHPRVIICDEPFAGVDPKSISELKLLLRDIAHKHQMGIIISDHNVDQLLTGSDYVYVMLDGQIVTSGTPNDILQDSTTRTHYLGDLFHAEMQKKIS